MTARATHARTDVPADSSNPDEIQPSDWLADHVLVDVASLSRSIQPATVTLSSADILALNSTPITLVAAPGEGKVVMVHRVAAFSTFGTTVYTLVDNVWVQYASLNSNICSQTLNSALTNAGDVFTPLSGGDVAIDTALVANTAVLLNAIDGNPTLGDGTLTVTVWYSVEDVPA